MKSKVIYVSADDYGLCAPASEHILECISCGAINKVSIFPNFDRVDLNKPAEMSAHLSLHLNLVEGKCMADPAKVSMLVNEHGNFKYNFIGLLKLSLLNPKDFSLQVYNEIKAQIAFWESILPPGASFCIDGHQHTHMIPAVFDALVKILDEEQIKPDYMRIPYEPLSPFIKTPALYFTYSPVNVIKQWLLNFLWLINKKNGAKFHTALFFGILFSGKMDEKRVSKILPKLEKLAIKKDMDIEILFHPGYLDKQDDLKGTDASFKKFYLSSNRKDEFNSVMKLHKK